MERALTLYRTTVGKKALMATSGVVLFGYVIGHLLGNLQIFVGAEAINGYAAWLRTQPALLWGTRVLLLFATAAHVASAISLGQQNRQARPIAYKVRKDLATNYAARTMYWSGPILAFYIVYHLAHLTFGVSTYEWEPGNLYNNMVHGFQVWWISAVYIVGNLALGFHLFHGVWAMFGSVGISHPKWNPFRRNFAAVFALLITLGNLSIPIAVLAGVVQPTSAQSQYLNPER